MLKQKSIYSTCRWLPPVHRIICVFFLSFAFYLDLRHRCLSSTPANRFPWINTDRRRPKQCYTSAARFRRFRREISIRNIKRFLSITLHRLNVHNKCNQFLSLLSSNLQSVLFFKCTATNSRLVFSLDLKWFKECVYER